MGLCDSQVEGWGYVIEGCGYVMGVEGWGYVIYRWRGVAM